MKRKTAIKKLMGLGASRNYANDFLNTVRYWKPMSNADVVESYKTSEHYYPFIINVIGVRGKHETRVTNPLTVEVGVDAI